VSLLIRNYLSPLALFIIMVERGGSANLYIHPFVICTMLYLRFLVFFFPFSFWWVVVLVGDGFLNYI
jgi:hypothetical protein